MDEDKEEKGFTISDKRFSARKEEETSAEPEEKPEEPAPSAESGPELDEEEATGEEPPAQEQEIPQINFLTFLLSLNNSALFLLGELKNPQTDEAEVDMMRARQTIDIIGVLKEKTKGNLNEEEEMLLDDILYDLRMRYAKKANP